MSVYDRRVVYSITLLVGFAIVVSALFLAGVPMTRLWILAPVWLAVSFVYATRALRCPQCRSLRLFNRAGLPTAKCLDCGAALNRNAPG